MDFLEVLSIEAVCVSILCAASLELQTWRDSVSHVREAQGDTISAMTRFSDAARNAQLKPQSFIRMLFEAAELFALWGEGGLQS